MPLSWNEIKTRALAFSKEWQDEASEHAEAQSFWNAFFHIFGISRRRVASFEHSVEKLGNKRGHIDLFWRGVLLVEHKSRGKDLDSAYDQAIDYFHGIAERDLPRYVLVSDFARFRLYDLEENISHEFELAELHVNIQLFGFIAGYQTHKIQEQDPVNIEAAERMGTLHDQMREAGYTGHALEVYLVRLLFCLFAEDTGIFQRQQLQDYIEQRTHEDGSDLALHLTALFQVLNTPENQRLKNLDEQLAAFPYINGQLFAELLPTASFDSAMRQTLLDCCGLDWGRISPAIFGSLFQSIMDKTARRNLGAHYTSEGNILKLIKPLFLDELWIEFERIKTNAKRLLEFQQKLRSLTFLDPACGCGNFLVIAYRELRQLELEVLRAARAGDQLALDVSSLILVDVDQFYGIEIEEFPAQIAQVALWLMDHQMNLQVSQEFGAYFARIPLHARGTIVHANALQLDWNEVITADKLSYIMGNPPFLGKKEQSKEQKADFASVMGHIKSSGVLDFVAAWYVKAIDMMQGSSIRCAFVSTNSIVQGEQVGTLWKFMLAKDAKIFFAHRTFNWTNEARGKAAVHCVIIGFSIPKVTPKYIYEYEDVKGEPQVLQAKNISPYLIEGSDIVLASRNSPLSESLALMEGSALIDNGFFLLDEQEYSEVSKKEPQIKPMLKKLYSGADFLNNKYRWCLWLTELSPKLLQSSPFVLQRIGKVKEFRLASNREATKKLAEQPFLFGEIRQPTSTYLFVPKTSSSRRNYCPIGFMHPDDLINNTSLFMDNASLFEFGVMSSIMHNAWLRTVAGRLKNDYRYSVKVVYNNFPWPQNPTDKQTQAIEKAAQEVLDARSEFTDSSLADLYDPLTMPPALLKAHQKLDKAVDAAYGKTSFKTEAERVAFLFELYQQLTEG